MTVRLATVIDVLDEAYPPALAQSWDSVGLVCGDPDDVLSSVTIAVDATAAVVTRFPTVACCWPTIRCCCVGWTRWRPVPPRARWYTA